MTEWQEVSFGKIPKEWDSKQIDVIKSSAKNSIAMGPFGSNIKIENYVAEGIPVIRGTNLNYYRYVDGDFTFLTEKKANELKASNCMPEDIVFTHRGTIGQVCLVPNGKYQRYVVSQSGMKLTLNKDIVDPYFCFYFFKSDVGQHQLLKYESQVGVPSISNPITSLKEIEIPCPQIAEQKAIAAILSSFDDKIDLLHLQNSTLESMAEALFRQWFVVEAKNEWEEKSLLHYVKLIGGGTPKTSVREYWNGSIPWLSGGDISSAHKLFALESVKTITEVGVENSSAKVLPQYATVVTARGTVGKFCLLGKPMAYSQTNYGILPVDNRSYFFTFLLVDHVVKELQMSAYGSVFDTITTQTFEEVRISLPKDDVLIKFEGQVSSLFSKIFANQAQIRTLEKLRDTLLPKLMSGEVRVEF